MQEIEKELSKMYNINITKMYPLKDFFILETTSGKKILRNINFSPERILFIHGAKEHLSKNEFENTDRFLYSKDNSPYVLINGLYYTLTEIVDGRECDFDKREDVIRASKALALLHRASKGYIPPEKSISKDDLGKLPLQFSKRLEEIKRVKKVATREKGKLDYLLLDCVDYFYELGEDAIRKLQKSKYLECVEMTRKEKTFCHHDYTHCNIICSGEKTSVINFNYCSYELKVYDIANLLRRKMRKCDWDIREAKVIIDSYRSIEEISEEDFEILRIMLQFPQKFWRVVNKYYNSKRTIREKSIKEKLNEVIDEVKYHKIFLDKFELLES